MEKKIVVLGLVVLLGILGSCGKAKAPTRETVQDPNAPSSRGPAAEPYSSGPTSPQPK